MKASIRHGRCFFGGENDGDIINYWIACPKGRHQYKEEKKL